MKGIHQDDATACYDRIVMNYVIINIHKYQITDNICKLNWEAQRRIVYKTQTEDHASKYSHTNTGTFSS